MPVLPVTLKIPVIKYIGSLLVAKILIAAAVTTKIKNTNLQV